MSREAHVRFWESPGVRFPRATRLPLERQARIMSRQGLTIESKTLWDQIDVLAQHLQPAYDRLHTYLLTNPVLGADETSWRLLGHNGKASKRWYAWALCSQNAVVYRIDQSRSAQAARAIIRDFAGTLVCDGYTAYHALQKQGAGFRIAHCWAHVRRKYIEAGDTAPAAAKEILDHIAALYAIEREMRDRPPDEVLHARETRWRIVLREIQQWTLSQRTLPQSPLGKAIGYMSSLSPGDSLARRRRSPPPPAPSPTSLQKWRARALGRQSADATENSAPAAQSPRLFRAEAG